MTTQFRKIFCGYSTFTEEIKKFMVKYRIENKTNTQNRAVEKGKPNLLQSNCTGTKIVGCCIDDLLYRKRMTSVLVCHLEDC